MPLVGAGSYACPRSPAPLRTPCPSRRPPGMPSPTVPRPTGRRVTARCTVAQARSTPASRGRSASCRGSACSVAPPVIDEPEVEQCRRGAACCAPPAHQGSCVRGGAHCAVQPQGVEAQPRRAPTGTVCLSRSTPTRPREQGGEGGPCVGAPGPAPLRHTGSPCPRPLAWRRPATSDRGPACRAPTDVACHIPIGVACHAPPACDTSSALWDGRCQATHLPCPPRIPGVQRAASL
jgi:hypothetical protein